MPIMCSDQVYLHFCPYPHHQISLPIPRVLFSLTHRVHAALLTHAWVQGRLLEHGQPFRGLLTEGSSLFLFTHTLQEPLPRGLCHPLWAGSYWIN